MQYLSAHILPLIVLRSTIFDIGILSTRVFETRTATGREHFACHDSDVSQIFVIIISNGEKILSMWLCEDMLKGKTAHFRLLSASQKRACLISSLLIDPRSPTNSRLCTAVQPSQSLWACVSACLQATWRSRWIVVQNSQRCGEYQVYFCSKCCYSHREL